MKTNVIKQYPLKVAWNENKRSMNLTLSYSLFLPKNELIKTLFTTADISGNLNGFIPLHNGLFIKFIFGNNKSKIIEKALPSNVLKISVDSKKRDLNITFFPEEEFAQLISGKVHLEATSMLTSLKLKDFYYSLVVTDRKELIAIKSPNKGLGKSINVANIQQQKIKDFMDADRFSYGYNPNMDGQRKVNEYLAGTGSNLRGTR